MSHPNKQLQAWSPSGFRSCPPCSSCSQLVLSSTICRLFFLTGWLEKDTRSAAQCSDKSDIPKAPREGEKWGGKSSGITRTNGKSCSKKKNPLGQGRGRGTGWERTPQPGWQRAEGALSCTGQRLPCIQRSTAEQRRASAPPFCRRGALSTGGTRSCCSASRGGPRKWPKGRNSSTVGMG